MDQHNYFLRLYKESVLMHGDHSNLHRKLGQFAMKERRWDDAIDHFHKALENYYTRAKPDKTLKAVLYIDLQDAHLYKGDYDLAIVYCLAQVEIEISCGMAISQIYNQMKNEWIFLENNYIVSYEISNILFDKYKKNGKIEDLEWAFKFCELAIHYMYNPLNTLDESKKITVIADFANHILNGAMEIIHELYVNTKSKDYLRSYLNLIDMAKASILSGDQQHIYLKHNIPFNLVENEKVLQSKMKKLVVQKDFTNDSMHIWQSSLRKLFNIYKKEYPEFFKDKFEKHDIKINEVQNSLSARMSVLSYNLNQDKLYIFVINRDSCYLIQKQIDTSRLNKLVMLQRKSADDGYSQIASEWYEILIPENEKKYSILNIIPDETLYQLSFEALMTQVHSDSINYAIFKHNIIVSPSLSYVINRKNSALDITSDTPAALFSFSDKNTIVNQNGINRELPGSYKEVYLLKQILKKAAVYSGLNSTIKNFKRAYTKQNKAILHLSLHGHSEVSQRDNAYLLFRKEKDYNSLDTLYSYDIEQLTSDSRIIILSACETGSGKVIAQEGAYSLARSFLRNGAQSVISSLWSLDDSSTKNIMTSFYFQHAGNVSDRLRSSKINFIQSHKQNHPYYWAGLVLNE